MQSCQFGGQETHYRHTERTLTSRGVDGVLLPNQEMLPGSLRFSALSAVLGQLTQSGVHWPHCTGAAPRQNPRLGLR